MGGRRCQRRVGGGSAGGRSLVCSGGRGRWGARHVSAPARVLGWAGRHHGDGR